MAQIRRSLGPSSSNRQDWYKRAAWVFGVGLLILGLAFAEQEGRELFRYQRDSIENGQWWRLVTGHFVHLGWSHVFLNLTGWILISMVFGADYSSRQWLVIYFASMLIMGLGFWWLDPQLRWYVGLSGLLHGGIVAGLLAWSVQGDRLAWLALGVVIAKLLWEQMVGPVPMTEEAAGGPVVVNAHLYGSIGGLLGALAVRPWRKVV